VSCVSRSDDSTFATQDEAEPQDAWRARRALRTGFSACRPYKSIGRGRGRVLSALTARTTFLMTALAVRPVVISGNESADRQT